MAYREATDVRIELAPGPELPAPEHPTLLKALPWFFAAVVPVSLFVALPPHAWFLYTAWLGVIGGGALADAIHRLRNPPRFGAPTVLQRAGHRLIVTTNDRAFEMDVTDVRRAN